MPGPSQAQQDLNQIIAQGSNLNDILPRQTGVKYPKVIDRSSGYYNLKLDEQSSYSTTSCLFGRYIYIWLLFGVVPADDVFQRNIADISQGVSNVIWYCWWRSDCSVWWSRYRLWCNTRQGIKNMQKSKTETKQNKYLFRHTSIPVFTEIRLQYGVNPDPRKVQALMKMPPLKSKKELQSFQGILNYLSRLLPVSP